MDEISIDDFGKVDIRIGTIIKAEVPEWSHWVIKLTVDLGEEIGERTIFSGIMKFYQPSDLEGKQFPFIVNLKPKKIGPEGDFSEGMMIMATVEPQASLMATVPDESGEPEKELPILLNVGKAVPNGSKVR